MPKILTLILTIFLAGCTVGTKIKTVEVPIYSCPEPIIPDLPKLAIYDITQKSSDKIVLKSYGQSIDQLLLHIDTLTNQLKAYQGK